MIGLARGRSSVHGERCQYKGVKKRDLMHNKPGKRRSVRISWLFTLG
jgi:hypothetical protein